MPRMRATWALSLLLACNADPAPMPAATPTPSKPAPTGKPRLVAAPAGGGVAEVVTAELAEASGERLVVYVGASWCEPCVAFHDALTAGQLDAEFPGVRFLVFDLDRDKPRLVADGYSSRFVPLFAIPGPDGRASGEQIEGGVKGAGAAANLVARLKPLLAGR